MKFVVLGRGRALFESIDELSRVGHQLVAVFSPKAPPEYPVQQDDFRRKAAAFGVPFFSRAADLESTELRAMGADVGISVNFPTIIGAESIGAFRFGVLNAHGGDLPRFKGNACQAWAIILGEPVVGLVIHRMIPDVLDDGPVMARRELALDLSTQIGDVFEWIDSQVPSMFAESLSDLEETAENQPTSIALSRGGQGFRCYPRREEDGRIFWSGDAVSIIRLINASSRPYPGAYCFFNGRKVRIFRAFMGDGGSHICAVPGQVTSISGDFIRVAVADGELVIPTAEAILEDTGEHLSVASIRERLS